MTLTKLALLQLFLFVINKQVFCENVTKQTSGVRAFEGIYKDICKINKCVWKCCPEGEYVSGRIEKFCKKPALPLAPMTSFNDLPLYKKADVPSGKHLKNVYKIVPNAFKDLIFRDFTFDYSDEQVGHLHYLTENEILIEIAPNQFQGKLELDKHSFCVDNHLDDNDTITTASFWSFIRPTMQDDETRDMAFNIAGFLISCVFLALTLLVYCLLPALHTLSGMILMAYIASMFCTFLLFAVLQLGPYLTEVCLGISYAAYFCTLSVFCWMTVMSYDFWSLNCKHFYNRKRSQRSALSKFRIHCSFAFGIPAGMTIFLAIVNHVNMRSLPFFITPNIPKGGCFIAGGHKLLYLYVPMLILILTNWIFFVLSSCSLWLEFRATSVLDKEAKAGGARLAHRSQKARFFVYLKLSIIMGIMWLLEVVSFFYSGWKFWYITDCYNMLVGLCIFIIFVCNKKMYRRLRLKFGRRESVEKSIVEVDI